METFNLALYGKQNRENLMKHLNNGLVYVEAGQIINLYHTDYELAFRQEPNFYYLTGIDIADHGAIINMETKEFIVVAPFIGRDVSMWCGKGPSDEFYLETVGADKIIRPEELEKYLEGTEGTIHIIPNLINIATKMFEENDALNARLNVEDLKWALCEARMIKSEMEIEITRKSCQMNAETFFQMMKLCKPGISEHYMSVHMDYFAKKQDPTNRHMAFGSICAQGNSASVLHYVKADQILEAGKLFMLDAGIEHNHYSSDNTRTFPVDGKFNKHQKELYNAVLDALLQCSEFLRPGVTNAEAHRLAEKIITQHFIDLGIFTASLEECLAAHAINNFFVHGLGHFMGLDVHDCGGYAKGQERINEPGICYLRCNRTMAPGMIITVEPGVYFIDEFIEPMKSDSKYEGMVDFDKIEEYRQHVGGIRIEDDILITENGRENLSQMLPHTIEEVEAACA
eukprot:TRINITY_DN3320_c2_g1_i22.p1 TRINITY_DN3320_c2_g1~~TRINITY_DN3320_c2_g1_i22.p1  ORF type:complete len:466 (-),score=153.15 TRINITY_DN3320_c2_g1_i22:224-1591(-)